MVIFLWKRGLAIVLAVMLLLDMMSPAEVAADTNLSMYSGSYALTDARNHRVLTGKKEESPMANASTTKILTCIVTLEHADLSQEVTVSKKAASQPKVRLGMKAGETYMLKDLLYALMLESYNDCAVAIAEHVGGSVEGFAKLMNEKALKIGCKDTYFITPNGLDAEDDNSFHHTTAIDLCRIMAYCVWESPQKETFLEITQTRNYKSYVNRNSFLDQMDGVLSGKTGYTSKAGYCYVAAFERDGERYCIALLACGWPNNKTYKWKDAKTLLNHGMENYELVTRQSEKLQKTLLVDGYVGCPEYINLNQDMSLIMSGQSEVLELLLSENEMIETELILKPEITLPIEKGDVLGVCNYYIEDVLLETVELLATEHAGAWGLEDIVITVYKKFLSFS